MTPGDEAEVGVVLFWDVRQEELVFEVDWQAVRRNTNLAARATGVEVPPRHLASGIVAFVLFKELVDGVKTRGYLISRDDVLEMRISLIFPMLKLLVIQSIHPDLPSRYGLSLLTKYISLCEYCNWCV